MKIKLSEIRNIVREVIKESETSNFVTVYRSINKPWNENHDMVQYFAKNKYYSKNFGRITYDVKLKIDALLNLNDINNLLKKHGVSSDFYLYVGELGINNNYQDQIGYYEQEIGGEIAGKIYDLIKDSKIIYGEDDGFPGEYVYAVKDKNLIQSYKLIG